MLVLAGMEQDQIDLSLKVNMSVHDLPATTTSLPND
jgi:hypothetical protein